MELSYFNKMRTIHNTLSTPGYTFTEMDLKGRISFSESVNAGEELTIGSCVMSTIEFSLFDLNYLVDDITGKEFTWTKSVQTGQNHYKKLAKASRAGVVCINGEVSYVFNSRPPYVSIWDVETVSKISEPTAQPAQAVEGAAVVGNTLYCFHHESPYLTTYNISGQNLSQASAPALNRFHQEKIREYCKMGYSCNLQGDILKEYHVELYDQKPVNLIETVFERVQMGLFKAEKPVKSNDTLIKVSCTDRLNLFDRYVDSWLNQINYPTTIANLLRGLCAFVGVQAESYTFLNSDFQVKRNFIGQNVNGLQVLRWIAEAAANFGKITPAGKLKLGWYEPLDYTLDESVYRSITNEEYQVKKIDKLQVRVVENDIGVIVPADDPSRTNAYVLENNPLLYAETDAELRSTAQKIYDAIRNITYYPYSVELHQNPLIHAGNIITISTRKGLTFQAYIMNRETQGGMETLSAVGGRERIAQSDMVNQSLQQLRGSVHTFINDVEQLNSTITEYRRETIEAIDQANENLSNFTDQVAGDLSGLQAQIDGQIESWFYDYEPTLNNPPASEWKTTQDKDKHLGDLFYNSKTGIGYRFSKAGNTYKWEILKDTDIGKALADAQKAQDTADGKRRVFVATPKPPYDVGDLWANATYSGKYSNDLLRCKTARASGSLNINDWEKASKYTDDTKANEAIAKITVVQSEIEQLSDEISLRVTQTQVDQSIADSETAINNQLKGYAKKSEVKVTTDAIILEVSKKFNAGDFSTTLQQDSTSVQIAWNNIDKKVQFEEGELRIYDTSVSPAKVSSKFNYMGNHFYRDDYYVGKIGTDYYQGDSTQKGLVFSLGNNAAYMSWSRATTQNDEINNNYAMMWSYISPGHKLGSITGDAENGTLYSACPINMGGRELRNSKITGCNLTESFPFNDPDVVTETFRVPTGSGVARYTLTFWKGLLVGFEK